jgi:NAD(P)-dependent dehydrogenase (short-subunit alcohol dehydrogenase family)
VTANRALITGGSSGVGLAVARRVHKNGGSVALLARRPEPLQRVLAEFGDRAFAFPADVADPDAVARAVDGAFGALGTVDLVVNCAGVVKLAELADLEPRVWQDTISVNLSGAFYVAREAALRMSSGCIINLGSELSTLGMGCYVHYCASKAGVIGLTKAMAAELAPRGIRVNAVCPGPVDTPMLEYELRWFGDPARTRADALERVPLKRFATPEEVADAVMYLSSAEFATGASLALDGGTTVM